MPASPPDPALEQEAREARERLLRALDGHGSEGLRCVELCPICRAADVLRSTAPEELRESWQSVQREALLTIKALIDHYVERLPEDGRPEDRGPQVTDIPIS